MIASRTKSGIVFGLFMLLALPAAAQAPADSSSPDRRDASFLPPPSLAPDGPAVPARAAQNSGSTNEPVVSPAKTAPVNSPAPAPPAAAPVNIVGAPVESGELHGIDADSIGLLAPDNGGLGAAIWKGTPRELVERLLPGLSLPTVSPVLNNLAQRLLLTTANVPEGVSSGSKSLTALRVEKLLALGDADDAWDLALLAKSGQVDEATLRRAAEAALIGGRSKDLCAKLPDIIRSHKDPEWQKSLVVCQLRANDTVEAQLGLDVLHAQDVKDDTFFQLAERNVIGGAKSLPRQLTPLKPLNLGLLRLIDLPLPPEVYSHPDAALVPELLKTHARDGMNTNIMLAERAAAHGIINGAQLGGVYGSFVSIAGALNDSAPGIQRAMLYQTALQEKDPKKRLDDAIKFLQSLNPADLSSAMSQVLVAIIGDIQPSVDYAASAPAVTRIFIMAGKPKEALGWLKLARQTTAGSPDATAQLQELWPLVVLSGLEADGDYGQAFNPWLDAALKDADATRREQIGGILLLFDAAGFAVPEGAWAHAVDLPGAARRAPVLPALLLERLRMAGATDRRGEAVLLALAVASTSESSLLPTIETVRALRLVGLTADAFALAREEASLLLAPPEAKP